MTNFKVQKLTLNTIYGHINMAWIRNVIMVKAMKDGTERTAQGVEWDL